ncbi:winged helix DNA-binding protein [Agromyces ramosus]|uniref:Winged helix DNA-binding protein n=1 Tax=Agromyces ramosus TaxID=33879 RepID=A0A4Q7MHT3_9MICO|nr:winged helix DNA-binding domain-containing protein [Agromyces ramosus]RZS66282.1 winged helix DNA-binding protein [Agromyces ramosus]
MPKPASAARLRAARLDAHGLRTGLPSITAAVRRLGAVQAQDFAAARWVLGARVPGSASADVDAAIESREVVRSWPMRGTLHLLPTETLRPILAITGPRIMQRAATRHRQLELDREVYSRARELAETALAGGASLSREELLAAWEAAGIRTTGQRGYHLIWWLAQDAVLCCGPVEGRGQRFVLLDEWAPAAGRVPDRDETLANLAVAYAAGHGPVTVRDFAWWSGLTLTDARTAFAAAGGALVAFDEERVVAADAGWAADPASTTPRTSRRFVLAAFDEYFLGYTERSDVCDPLHAPRIVPGLNGVFQPILVNGAGVVEGLWKVTRAKGEASVALEGFERSIDPVGYEPALARWARFHGERLGAITTAT